MHGVMTMKYLTELNVVMVGTEVYHKNSCKIRLVAEESLGVRSINAKKFVRFSGRKERDRDEKYSRCCSFRFGK